MFCEQCGKPLSADAKFCSSCGHKVSPDAEQVLPYAPTAADRIAPDDPIRVFKPVFIPWVTATSVIPITLFMTVWAGGFCGGFSMFGLKGIGSVVGIQFPQGVTFVFWACVAFFGIPIGTYVAKSRSYAKTEYRLFRDRLEYYEGFLTIQQKTIAYTHVAEVNLQKGIIQRRYGLGTIVLSTPATGFERNAWRSGIRLVDVENPDEVYELVKQLVHDAQVKK